MHRWFYDSALMQLIGKRFTALFCISLLISGVGLPRDSAATATAVTTAQASQTAAISLTAGVEKTVLDNGLTVLLQPIRSAPVVTVQIAYGVGSVDEGEGEKGLSHQLEHLLFKGTQERPIQFGRLFSALGSKFNAFVSDDQTVYFNTVGKDKLDAILTLEADRMLNAQITPEQLATEKQVVISELQGYENNPGYQLRRNLLQAAYPDRAYGQPIGGTRTDVEGFTVEQVRDYYQKYYSPENATLVVIGDIETAPTLATVERLFGSLRAAEVATPRERGAVPPAEAIPMATQTEPVVVRRPGALPLVEVVYPLPNVTHPDSPIIDVMDTILTGGRASVLYQALVDSGMASAVGSIPKQLREPGWYTVQVSGNPGQSPTDIYEALQQALMPIQQQVTGSDELARAKEQYKAAFGFLAQEITGRARLLGLTETTAGDYSIIDGYLAAVEAVTTEDVLRVAQTYLAPEKAVVGFFEPSEAAPLQAPTVGTEPAENFSPTEPVSPAEVAQYLPPLVEPQAGQNPMSTQVLPEEFVLANGLRVLLLSEEGLPTVTMSGWIDAGDRFDPPGKSGTALLTATNLANGTQSRDALTLAKLTEGEGIRFSASSDVEGTNLSASMLAEDLPFGIEILADVLQNSAFPTEMLALSQQQLAGRLAAVLTSPGGLSSQLFQQSVYPEGHPAHPVPTPESISAITPSDVQTFYQQHYRPDTTVLTLVGDLDVAQTKAQLTEVFGNWQATGPATTVEVPAVALPERSIRLTENIPGSSEAITLMGYNAIARKDPRFYALRIVNEIIGGTTVSSRLGDSLRDQQALTYGVRSQIQSGMDGGPFVVSMQTAPENVERAVKSVIDVLKQVKTEGITAEELESAKRAIADRYPVQLADPGYLAAVLLRNNIYELAETELTTYPDQIEAVTLAEAEAVIEELIQPDKLVIVSAGPFG